MVLLLSLFSGHSGCPQNQIDSACLNNCNNATACVDTMAFLVGGKNSLEWRRDAEIINSIGEQFKIADFPSSIDVPYGFWAGAQIGLVVCGGKNWDVDIVDNKCWRYKACTDQWEHVTDMPFATSGGSGIPVKNKNGDWSLWIVGGGNGQEATKHTQILTPNTDQNGKVSWDWSVGPSLKVARFAGCGVLHTQANKIFIIGGRDNDNMHRTMEIIDVVANTTQMVEGWETPQTRWGTLCQYFVNDNGSAKIALMGGMDNFFIPHKNVHFIDENGLVEVGEDLPWAMSGHIGVPINGQPTVFGGYSLLGMRTSIASLRQGSWETWSAEMSSSRVSGLAVQVPQDMLQQC